MMMMMMMMMMVLVVLVVDDECDEKMSYSTASARWPRPPAKQGLFDPPHCLDCERNSIKKLVDFLYI